MESHDTTTEPGLAGVFLPPVPHPKEGYIAQGQWQRQAGHALSLHTAHDRTNTPSRVDQVQSHGLLLPTAPAQAVTLDNTTCLLPSSLPQFPNSFPAWRPLIPALHQLLPGTSKNPLLCPLLKLSSSAPSPCRASVPQQL